MNRYQSHAAIPILLLLGLSLLSASIPAEAARPAASRPPDASPSRAVSPANESAPPAMQIMPADDAFWQPLAMQRPNLAPPPTFTDSTLLAGVSRVAYIADTCQALRARHDSSRSGPGTVVLPLMFHGILAEQPTGGLPGKNISAAHFNAVMDMAHEAGFQTITMQQFIDFVYHNAPIPERSLLLIFDDRYPHSLTTYVYPKLRQFGWTASAAWISADTPDWQWDVLREGRAAGLLDVQSHGLWHIYVTEGTAPETVYEELYGPVAVYQQQFGSRPLAHIWPGGRYTRPAVQTARQAGYQVAFTVHPRGPVMYNAIPLGPEEQAMGDPLMTLPRLWPTFGVWDFYAQLQHAIGVSEAAKVFAAENAPLEQQYLAEVCGG